MSRARFRRLLDSLGLLSIYHDVKIGWRRSRGLAHSLYGSCRLCGARRLKLQRADLFHAVLHCRSCALQFVHPIPGRRALDRFYSRHRFLDERRKFHGVGEDAADWSDWIEFKKMTLAELGVPLLPGEPERGRLLEIGAGEGHLLDLFARKGWQVSAIELNRELAAALRRRGFETMSVPAEEFEAASGAYNLLLAFHVIEHLRDPFAALVRMRAWLREGGSLVLETPVSRNYESVDHLFFFTAGNIERALVDRGFRVVKRFAYTDRKHPEFHNLAVRAQAV